MANAQLIAAAPELLEALIRCDEALEPFLMSIEKGKDPSAESAHEYAQGMIAKAKGIEKGEL